MVVLQCWHLLFNKLTTCTKLTHKECDYLYMLIPSWMREHFSVMYRLILQQPQQLWSSVKIRCHFHTSSEKLLFRWASLIIILSFDIAPFPYKHAQRRITFHCQRIDVDIHIVNWYIHLWTDVFSIVVWRLPHSQLHEYYLGADSIVLGHRH